MNSSKTTETAVENRPFPLLRPAPAEGLPGKILVGAGALAFWILAREKTPGSLGLAEIVCAVPVLIGLAWMIRRRYMQGLFLSGQLLLIVLLTSGGFRRAAFPLGALVILPAALMVWGLLGMARASDELERRVLQGALVLACGIAVFGVLAYSFAETLGAPRLPAMTWFEVLVLGLYAGLVIEARRYS